MLQCYGFATGLWFCNIVIYMGHRITLRWRHNGCNSVSNHQPHDCLHNRLFRRTSKKTSKLRVTGLCAGNSPETGEFLEQMASNAENISIRWRHYSRRPYCWELNGSCGIPIITSVFSHSHVEIVYVKYIYIRIDIFWFLSGRATFQVST